jgi:hypothetical protein
MYAASERLNSLAGTPDGSHVDDEIPAAIRTELNAYMDRDIIVRMRYLARKKRMLGPDITDDEMADYLALAEGFQNFPQWMSTRRSKLQTPLRAATGWATAIAIILGLLTAMLMVAIAITV